VSGPQPITIVSGLPRSGTSLLLQMLAAGGLPVLSDGARAPDVSNPRGYFEWEPARRLCREPDAIRAARGHAVKVISALLAGLPSGERYRVLFLERDLDEVEASQRRMLARTGAPADAVTSADLAAHVAQVRGWLLGRPDLETCFVAHRDLLERPGLAARRVRDFLAAELDVVAMAAAVDPSLWRERRQERGRVRFVR
jgi:hypothetical protein